jgi:tetratricopeptide (TPR) repeat protein
MLAALLIVGAALAAYHNSFPGTFLFDDTSSIIENRSIRKLSALGSVLSPPPEAGVGGRPFANLTFAANYAVSQLNVGSYHALNLAIHVAAALTLFGIVRRTLGGSRIFSANATPVAAMSAILWVVHPLSTAVVNYASQRTESLMALFYLLTLYAFIRSVETRATRWAVLSVIACAFGMASKEVMITAPVLVLLYDRTFVAGTLRQAWLMRWRYYAGLATTWLLLAGLVSTSPLTERGVGFDLGITWVNYALTQARAVLLYLGLAVWPQRLVFDYGWTFERSISSAALYVVVALALVIASAVVLRRGRLIGFAGCAVFLILAPTSSVVPIIQQPIAESRMYLPLAVLMPIFVGIWTKLTRGTPVPRGVGVPSMFETVQTRGDHTREGAFVALRARVIVPLAAAIIALGCLTVQRNITYQTEIALWSDTIAKRPDSARAHGNLSAALLRADHIPEAIIAAQRAIEMMPNYPDAHHNLGVGLAKSGRFADAIEHYERALQLRPVSPNTHCAFGDALLALGRTPEAVTRYEAALRFDPRHAQAHNNLSVVLLKLGRAAEAAEQCRAALQSEPTFAEAHYNLGNALAQIGDYAAAAAAYETAIRFNPRFAKAYNNLGVLKLRSGHPDEAMIQFEAALRVDPAYAEARKNLATVRSTEANRNR